MATIVEFVGLPGTGKTTLSQEVVKELTNVGIPVFEPTYNLETSPRIIRVILKSRYLASGFLQDPYTGFALFRDVLKIDQHSTIDYIRVLFNLLYVTSVVTTYKSGNGACILDQGPYQGIWSVGFSSSDGWSNIIDRFSKLLQDKSPDLIVFVEADEKIISDRLHERIEGDTRFEPN